MDNSLFAGNAFTVVNFWFNGCKPCVEELDVELPKPSASTPRRWTATSRALMPPKTAGDNGRKLPQHLLCLRQ